MIFRFYYYVFLRHFIKKVKDPTPWFRALLMVNLTTLFMILFCFVIIDAALFNSDARIYNHKFLFFGIIGLLFFISYQTFVKNGRTVTIIREFQNHSIDTKRNRMLCWIIFFGIFIIVMLTTAVLRGK